MVGVLRGLAVTQGCGDANGIGFEEMNGRDGQIRTADPSHPKRVLYQAEPRPDTMEPARVSRPPGSESVYTSGACRAAAGSS